MKTIINGLEIEGTPQEMFEMSKITSKQVYQNTTGTVEMTITATGNMDGLTAQETTTTADKPKKKYVRKKSKHNTRWSTEEDEKLRAAYHETRGKGRKKRSKALSKLSKELKRKKNTLMARAYDKTWSYIFPI